ncbi:MAG: sensor histidine kinase [Pseudomonadota bacterium]
MTLQAPTQSMPAHPSEASLAPVRGAIRRRLMVQLLGGAAILALALFVIVQSLARQLAQESQDNILTAAASAMLDTVVMQEGDLQVDLPYAAFSMLSSLSGERVFYAVHAPQGIITGYSDLEPIPGSGTRFATERFRGEEVRQITATRLLALEQGPLPVTITLAQTRDGQARTLSEIQAMAAALGTGFFLCVAVLAGLAAHTSIGPILRLTDSVKRRGPQDLRPVTAPVPVEMAPLVGAINTFMDRLKLSLQRSEEFIADAAHRVRTPLATVRTQAEITLRRVEKEENRASVREMIRAIDESSRAAGQLLDHAMVTFRADHLEPDEIDLRALAEETVDRLRPMADLRDIDIDLQGATEATIEGDRILVQSALRNVLDNAIKYSAPESAITLSLRRDADMAALDIVDRGIGFPEGSPQGLTGRFVRGANVEGVVGSGLGLTIAEEVARAHGGTLTASNNQEGPGACVTLYFPAV